MKPKLFNFRILENLIEVDDAERGDFSVGSDVILKQWQQLNKVG